MYSLNIHKNFMGLLAYMIHGPRLSFWGQVALAGASLVGGLMAKDSADSAASKQERAMDRQTQLGQDQLQFAKDQWDEYKNLYGDLEGSIIEDVEYYEVGENLDRYRGEAIADVASAYDKNREIMDRNMSRYGIDPGDGASQGANRQWALERAKAEVMGLNNARMKSEAEDDKAFANKLAVLSTGKQLPGAANAVTNAMGNMSNLYGNQATQFGNQANQFASTASRGFSNALNYGVQAFDGYNKANPGGDSVISSASSPYMGSDKYGAIMADPFE